MGYSADTFSAGEQPTTAKWNKLWSNDASFNDGTGIANLEIGAGHTSMKLDYKFSVYRAAAFSLSTGAATVIPYDTKLYDTGSNVDVATNKGRFTAPVAGFYHFNAQLAISPTVNSSVAFIDIRKNGSEINRGSRTVINGTDSLYLMISIELQLAATDFVEIGGFASATTQALEVSTALNWFTGFLVSQT